MENSLFPIGVRHFLALSTTVLFALTCQSCAVSYLDGNGDRHIIGFADITIHAPVESRTFAGDVVEVTAIGITASQTAQGGHLDVGYSHEITAALRDNALVVGDPLSPLSRSHQDTGGLP
jgi:hypothetical protein